MNLADVTALVLTYNESANIGRTLSRLARLPRVLVVDSGSDDDTAALVAAYSNAMLVTRPFDTHAKQWNYGLTHPELSSEWVLALDADYLPDDEFLQAISRATPDEDVSGLRARFIYCVFGKPIRSGAYPPVVVLFRRVRGRYVQDGHTHRLVVDGRVEDLAGAILHDDRKSLSRWLASQRAYASLEADKLERQDRGSLGWADKLRLLLLPMPLLVFAYTFLWRRGFMDGWHGLHYAFQRAYAELLLALELVDRRLRRKSG